MVQLRWPRYDGPATIVQRSVSSPAKPTIALLHGGTWNRSPKKMMGQHYTLLYEDNVGVLREFDKLSGRTKLNAIAC